MQNSTNVQLPCHTYLDELGIPYKKVSFPPSTEKGAANVARVLGLSERQAVKTLIFDTNKAEFVLVMLGGDQNAISGLLKKALGSRNIRLAQAEKVVEITGYVIGSIPPFHWQPQDFRTFIEQSLLEEEVLGVGTGSWGHEIIIEPKDLVRASSAVVVNLTCREEEEEKES